MVESLALLSSIAFMVLGWHELLAMAAAYLLMLSAAILMSLGDTSFSAATSVSGRRVTVGDTVRVSMSVCNSGHSPTASAHASLPIDGNHERFGIPPLAAGQRYDDYVEFTAMARTVLQIGPLSIRKGDPFGLVCREKRFDERMQIFVHPPIVPVAMVEMGAQRDLDGHSSRGIVDDDLDFHGLREYGPGDDLRNVHWLSCAKTDVLMIRQYEATRRTDTALVLSVNSYDYADSREFELAVSIHASIGVARLLRNLPITTHIGDVHATPADATAFLDSCSSIRPESDEVPNLAQSLLEHAGNASFFCFTVGQFKDMDEIRRTVLALPSSSTCVVLQAAMGRQSTVHGFTNFTLATIGDLNDLPAIMGALT
jgi:uncharacterized protein (DUF58 family)